MESGVEFVAVDFPQANHLTVQGLFYCPCVYRAQPYARAPNGVDTVDALLSACLRGDASDISILAAISLEKTAK
jgi:hypothetical protein